MTEVSQRLPKPYVAYYVGLDITRPPLAAKKDFSVHDKTVTGPVHTVREIDERNLR